MHVAENLALVRERIAAAARAAGRAPESIRLVAVSKTKPAEMIREAYAAGQRDFGENYAQELAEKAAELADLGDLRWHFIGHLQSNKAKLVAPIAKLVHTVDSSSLARELAKRATNLAVLVEVNVGGEAQKHGVAPEALPALLAEITDLDVQGLMTVPPPGHDEAAKAFAKLAELARTAKLPELSMGMSDDLELAIAAGATMVRIGSAIFGERQR